MQTSRNTANRSLIFGWSWLALFMLGGLLLESLHLFKSAFYFEVAIRRELWTLAHAHGALLALVNIVLGLYFTHFGLPSTRTIANLMIAAAIFMPFGFLLGGVGNNEVDPSLAILMTPIGAVLAILAIAILVKQHLNVAISESARK